VKLAEGAVYASIPAAKMDYLLNPEHPENRGKARLFAALGYTLSNWRQLEQGPAVAASDA
jgi:hypothetical protein